ncbi:hypothetical protein LTR48_004425 [Friedmanniomyces endolithicus]|uniref:Orc1-like AAA ATPase domain-containing protein n=1 Tax=Rachicladosporium monterosium TaxID=1507873 RepID=A0ABR0L5G3_9PEZI|nr:hypothetical protein LTR48_004425 [Friedmanniomyces endolithicus]KAK5143795.1 hypothetical protein LTR32_004149 [Rachicladosporium monterosium]
MGEQLLLPDELLLMLSEKWTCRDQQLRQLRTLVSHDRINLVQPKLHVQATTPSTVVVYGPCATGKSRVIQAYLESHVTKFAIVNCRECITGRHLFERTVAAVAASLWNDKPEANRNDTYNERCENLAALVVHLQKLLKMHEKFVLVFDGVDKQRESAPTLLPALARLGEYVSGLITIMIVQHPPPRFLHQSGVPYIHFPAYTRAQSVHILSRNPPDIFLELPTDVPDYDAENAARDLVSFRALCIKLWRPFVAPILAGDFGTRDFSRLLVAQRRLFQDETVLLDSIIASPTLAPPTAPSQDKPSKSFSAHELPYYAKYLLLAAYLASFNPAKTDALYFMKSTERKRRKKGGGTARSGGRVSQKRQAPRHLLGAAAFTLDRVLSVLHAILPDDLRGTVDVYTLVATLTSLKLLVRGGGLGAGDALEAGGKWKVGAAVSWEYVQGLARSVDFGLSDYVAE